MMKPDDPDQEKIKLTVNAKITYDLDPVTGQTSQAVAESQGGITITITRLPNEPIQEVRLKGRTIVMKLSPSSTPAKK